MMIHDVTKLAGKWKKRKRVGRGVGSGLGKTSARGHKGARARSGYSRKAGHEGGQMPLLRRLPKRGFSNANFRVEYAVVNLRDLDAAFNDGDTVTVVELVAKGLVRNQKTPVKVLADGALGKRLSVTAAKFSKVAQDKIVAAGGSVTVAE
jgi:large subunit ribosomal protein L15